MSLLFRKLQKNDFDKFNQLFEQVDKLHREAHPEYFRKTEKQFRTQAYFEKLLNDSTVFLLGAFDANCLVGLAHAAVKQHPITEIHVSGDYVLLDNLVVDENIRGNGIGKALYNGVCTWAKEQSIQEIQLKVYSFNEQAIRFYKKRGFNGFAISMRASL